MANIRFSYFTLNTRHTVLFLLPVYKIHKIYIFQSASKFHDAGLVYKIFTKALLSLSFILFDYSRVLNILYISLNHVRMPFCFHMTLFVKDIQVGGHYSQWDQEDTWSTHVNDEHIVSFFALIGRLWNGVKRIAFWNCDEAYIPQLAWRNFVETLLRGHRAHREKKNNK